MSPEAPEVQLITPYISFAPEIPSNSSRGTTLYHIVSNSLHVSSAILLPTQTLSPRSCYYYSKLRLMA